MKKTLIQAAMLMTLCTACGNALISGGNNDGTGNSNTVVAEAGNDGPDNNYPTNTANSNVPVYTTPKVAAIKGADFLFYQHMKNDGIAGVEADFLINSTANACADANSAVYHVNEVQLAFTLNDILDATVVPNTYVYPAGTSASYQIMSATYAVVNAPCYYNVLNLVQGTVTVTSANANTVTGTYNLTFSTGTITGSFSSAPCQAISVLG